MLSLYLHLLFLASTCHRIVYCRRPSTFLTEEGNEFIVVNLEQFEISDACGLLVGNAHGFDKDVRHLTLVGLATRLNKLFFIKLGHCVTISHMVRNSFNYNIFCAFTR